MRLLGIMATTSRLGVAWIVVALAPCAMAQTAPPAPATSDDLDVTMRVIVDPNAKVPDEIVRRISLPQPRTDKPPGREGDAPAESSAPATRGEERASQAREQGREFGQDVAEQARQRAEEARRNTRPPANPGPSTPPRNPPVTPPGPPATPPGGPPAPPTTPPGG